MNLKKGLKIVGLVGLASVLVLLLGVTIPGAVTQESGGITFRGLFVSGTGEEKDIRAFEYSVDLLESALAQGWGAGSINKENHSYWIVVTSQLKKLFKDAKDDDISVFLYVGHGFWKTDNHRTDEDEVDMSDEGIRPLDTVLDDDLGDPFKEIKGKKILIFDSCYSVGLWIGGKDTLNDLSKKILIGASRNETQFSPSANVSLFTLMLYGALTAGANAKYAIADKNTNGVVTVQEWFNFANDESLSFKGKELDPILKECLQRITALPSSELTGAIKELLNKIIGWGPYPEIKADKDDLNPAETPILELKGGVMPITSETFTNMKANYKNGVEKLLDLIKALPEKPTNEQLEIVLDTLKKLVRAPCDP